MNKVDERDITAFKELLLRVCGFSFEDAREKTLVAGVEQRMAQRALGSAGEYLKVVAQEPDECDRLVELLTVNETYFARERAHLDVLVEELVPELLKKRAGGRLKILCAGCSTGEEAYSVAMLLEERFGLGEVSPVAVVGVDIDAAALAKAKAGIYGRHSFRGTEASFRALHFEPCENGELRVNETVRRRVEFGLANLFDDTYPSLMLRPDVILYRNVSIYFPPQVQRDIFRRLAGILNEGGYLIVGAAETLFHDFGVLKLIQRASLYMFHKSSMPTASPSRRRSMRPLARGSASVRPPPAPRRSPSIAPRKVGVKSVIPAAPPAAKGVRRNYESCLEAARAKRYDEALAMLQELVVSEPSHVRARTLTANILLSTSRLDEARSVSERALGLDPLRPETCLILGIVARHDGRDDEALKRFREAIYLDAACWLAHYYLAEVLLTRGDRRRALRCFGTALRLLEKVNPEEPGCLPLPFSAVPFVALCRHKLTLLQGAP